jgi:ribosomal protein L40E
MFGFGAKTKCAKCESTSFRLRTIEPIDSDFPVNAVHCNKCGAPFGVVGSQNVGALLQEQKLLIANLGSKIDSIARQMDEIADAINQRSDQHR